MALNTNPVAYTESSSSTNMKSGFTIFEDPITFTSDAHYSITSHTILRRQGAALHRTDETDLWQQPPLPQQYCSAWGPCIQCLELRGACQYQNHFHSGISNLHPSSQRIATSMNTTFGIETLAAAVIPTSTDNAVELDAAAVENQTSRVSEGDSIPASAMKTAAREGVIFQCLCSVAHPARKDGVPSILDISDFSSPKQTAPTPTVAVAARQQQQQQQQQEQTGQISSIQHGVSITIRPPQQRRESKSHPIHGNHDSSGGWREGYMVKKIKGRLYWVRQSKRASAKK